ncbi:MAG TPA: LapA family protein [Xanthobacteraceae bacterium]|jgi:uncharacterized integral membrane protein
MIRKTISFLILVPLGLVIVALAVANRQSVMVSFDPFNTAAPAVVLHAPLFVLVFVLVIAGVIIGGIAAWLKQGKWRRAARRTEADLRAARNENDRLRREIAAREAALPPRPLSLRPPAA